MQIPHHLHQCLAPRSISSQLFPRYRLWNWDTNPSLVGKFWLLSPGLHLCIQLDCVLSLTKPRAQVTTAIFLLFFSLDWPQEPCLPTKYTIYQGLPESNNTASVCWASNCCAFSLWHIILLIIQSQLLSLCSDFFGCQLVLFWTESKQDVLEAVLQSWCDGSSYCP